MGHRLASMVLGGGLLLSTGNAFAQEQGAPSGEDALGRVHLGVRLGYGIPFGKLQGASVTTVGNMTTTARDTQLNDVFSGMIPIWLDVGVFVAPHVLVGLYGHYAIALVKSGDPGEAACPPSTDCSGSVIRLGVQGQYHLSRGQALDPWFGLGVGYEFANFSFGDVSLTAKGMEFVNLQAGADFSVANGVGVGPFTSFSVGQYSNLAVDSSVGHFSEDIPNKQTHEWVVFGVHGAFSL